MFAVKRQSLLGALLQKFFVSAISSCSYMSYIVDREFNSQMRCIDCLIITNMHNSCQLKIFEDFILFTCIARLSDFADILC